MGIRDRLKAMEARSDAWAAGRLSPEEFREAMALDRLVKDHGGRIALGYLALTALLTVLIAGLRPSLPTLEAFVLANILVVCFVVAGVGVWFGHRRRGKRPLWQVAAGVIAITTGGALTGALIGRYAKGEPFASIAGADLARMLSVGVLTGLVVAFFVVGATWIRGRESAAREAALVAQAERERFAQRTLEAELKMLQAQVEPHFLFNTLANLRYLVQTGSRESLPMLDHLIDYLRTALPEMRESRSTLGREAAHARAYLEILRLRMGGELAFTVEVGEGLADEPFPPLMLMTLVENAVKHGVAPVGHGRIAVVIAREEGDLRVAVEDDGRGISGPPGEGVGLANVRERLAALYGPGARVSLSPREGGGATAAIVVPGRVEAQRG